MGKVIGILFVTLIVIGVGFGFWYSKDMYKVLPVKEDASVEKSSLDKWKEYTDPHGRFSALFPGLPQYTADVKKDKKTGENKKYEVFSSTAPNGNLFVIILITFPKPLDHAEKEAQMKEVLNDFMSGNQNNELEHQEKSEFLGHDSLEMHIKNDKHEIEAKTFFDGDTLYVLNSVANDAFYNPKDFKFFVNSFQLLKQKEMPKMPAPTTQGGKNGS